MVKTHLTFLSLLYTLSTLGFSMNPVNVFKMLDFRVGRVKSALVNTKSRAPSLKIELDFGDGFNDLKQSSAQLRAVYGEGDHLLGKKILAVTNFPKIHVGIPSFFLTLGVIPNEGEELGTVVLIPQEDIEVGAKAILSGDLENSIGKERLEQVDPNETFHSLNIRVGTVESVEERSIDFGEYGHFSYHGNYEAFYKGLQVFRLFDESGSDNFIGFKLAAERFIPITVERPVQNGRILK